MATMSRGLGRGIQALFEDARQKNGEEASAGAFRYVPIDSVIPNPDQPRKNFNQEQLEELAATIRVHGILQPLLARTGKDGTYDLIAGERRLRAARLAGLAEVPIIINELDDQEKMIITLLENLHREDLNPIEQALGMEALRKAMNADMEALAKTVQQPRSTISNLLRLLSLPPAIQEEVAKGQISSSHAKILAGIESGEAAEKLASRIIEKSLTIRQTNDALAHFKQYGRFPWESADTAPKKPEKPKKKFPTRPEMLDLRGALAERLGCETEIWGTEEKGAIVLEYQGKEELSRLLAKLGVEGASASSPEESQPAAPERQESEPDNPQ